MRGREALICCSTYPHHWLIPVRADWGSNRKLGVWGRGSDPLSCLARLPSSFLKTQRRTQAGVRFLYRKNQVVSALVGCSHVPSAQADVVPSRAHLGGAEGPGGPSRV